MPPRTAMSLPIADIAVGDRIGFYNEAHAQRLGASIAANGQHAPIHVRRNGNAAKQRWTLIAGLHRLRGAESAGLTEMQAIQLADAKASDADMRRLELAENLAHRHRRPIERAIMMAEYGRLEEAVDHPGHVGETQQSRGARVRHSAAVTVTGAPDWRKRTADAFDVSVSTLERHQRLYRAICVEMSDLAQALNDHPLGVSLRGMCELTALPLDDLHDTRRRFVEALLKRDHWKSVKQAMVALGFKDSNGNRVDQTNNGAVLMNTWSKMPPRERSAHAEWIAHKVTPGLAMNMVAIFKRRNLL